MAPLLIVARLAAQIALLSYLLFIVDSTRFWILNVCRTYSDFLRPFPGVGFPTLSLAATPTLKIYF